MSGIGLLLMGGAGQMLAVTASPPALNSGASVHNFTTAETTAIATGGSGSYSYAWTKISDPFSSVTINSPATAATDFDLVVAAGGSFVATVRCTVTDTVTLLTAFVDVIINHTDFR